MGSVNGCRGYADWTRPERNGWLGLLRRHGIQPVHHFLQEGVERDDEQALVSMSVDAVDLARDLAIDVVVIVGNPHSTLDSRDPANPHRGRVVTAKRVSAVLVGIAAMVRAAAGTLGSRASTVETSTKLVWDASFTEVSNRCGACPFAYQPRPPEWTGNQS